MRHLFFGFLLSLLFASSAAAADVEVNGISLHFEEQGLGDPVLLLHGFSECGATWEPVAGQLAKKFRVITLDLRGHGRSTNPSRKFTHAEAADDIRELIKALGLERVKAVGFSSGGMTLLNLAMKSPHLIEKMVLVSSAQNIPQETRSMLREMSFDDIPPPVKQLMIECAAEGEAQARILHSQFQAFADMPDEMNFSASDLHRIEAETMIVHGDRDPFFPVSISVEMHRAIPRSELWVVPRGEHSNTAGAMPCDFAKAVETFLVR